MSVPSDRKYSKDHEWLKLDGDTATVGITEFAAAQLGDIVFVELPEVGASFQAGQSFGVVESTKTASDVFYPVSGKVLAVNDALLDAPELVNQDPYGKGWFIKIQCANNAELDALLDANTYATLI